MNTRVDTGRGCGIRRCSGCPLFGTAYGTQLEIKQGIVRSAFEERFSSNGTPVPEVAGTHPSPRVLGYRASAKLALAREGDVIRVGIYEARSHRVVDLSRCPIHHPLVEAGIRGLRSVLARAPSLLSGGLGGRGWLRYAGFQASVAEGKLVLALVSRTAAEPGLLRSLAARVREVVPELCGIAWNVNPTAGNEIFGPEWKHLAGEGFLRERLGALFFQASPGSFLQANREQAGWIYQSAAEWLAPEPFEEGLDLYSGVGALALHLAPRLRRMFGIEGSRGAISDARRAAMFANIENVSFLAGRVEEVLPGLAGEGYRPAVVSLNPPRKGADPLTLEVLRSVRPRAVLYVSCNPETLARDAAALCAGGAYQPEWIRPADLFPQTSHVETVALFRAGPVQETRP